MTGAGGMTELLPIQSNEDLISRVAASMPIVADLSRADALLYRAEGQRARIIAQARPHSVPPIWPQGIVGTVAELVVEDPLSRVIQRGRPAAAPANLVHGSAVRVVYPVTNPVGNIIALLAFDRTLIQEERQRHRQPAFRYTIDLLQRMNAHGQLVGADKLSPFTENDGIIVVNRKRQVQYVSGIANSLYNRAGFMFRLEGLPLDQLPTRDADLAFRAMDEMACIEDQERRPEGQYWIKKVIPLIGVKEPDRTWRSLLPTPNKEPEIVGAIITVHDETEERRRAQELKLKTDMLLELQHRVRNSLQTITALLRMQARRAQSAETRAVLAESIHRIMSVAAVHEFLYDPNERRVNLRALTERLVELLHPLIPPPLHITFRVEGEDIFIAGERATPAALVISELILNSVEHAFEGQPYGQISVHLAQKGSEVEVEVRDDGRGVPAGFSPDTGLSLVTTLTREGLRGEFTIANDPGGGAVARVVFTPYPSRNGSV